MCEGKTDTKHLQAAWKAFSGSYPQLDLRFTHASSDSELKKRIETFAAVPQTIPIVGLFGGEHRCACGSTRTAISRLGSTRKLRQIPDRRGVRAAQSKR